MWIVILPREQVVQYFPGDGPFKATLHGIIQRTSFPLKTVWEVIYNLRRCIHYNEVFFLIKIFPHVINSVHFIGENCLCLE